LTGAKGDKGDGGPAGMTGAQGDPGPAGTLEMADFYGNVANSGIAAGSAVPFAQNGPASGNILRITDKSFQLTNVGIYEVTIQLPISKSGQVVIALNGVELPYTVAGQSNSPNDPSIVQKVFVQTIIPNSLLEIRYPAANSGSTLKVVNSNGGNSAVTSHLIIVRVK
jgi:hypothetical protein